MQKKHSQQTKEKLSIITASVEEVCHWFQQSGLTEASFLDRVRSLNYHGAALLDSDEDWIRSVLCRDCNTQCMIQAIKVIKRKQSEFRGLPKQLIQQKIAILKSRGIHRNHNDNHNKRSRKEFVSRNPQNHDNHNAPKRKRRRTTTHSQNDNDNNHNNNQSRNRNQNRINVSNNKKKPKCQGKEWVSEEIRYAFWHRMSGQSYQDIAAYLERSKLAVLGKIDPLKRYFKENAIDPHQFDFHDPTLSLEAIKGQLEKEKVLKQEERIRRARSHIIPIIVQDGPSDVEMEDRS